MEMNCGCFVWQGQWEWYRAQPLVKNKVPKVIEFFYVHYPRVICTCLVVIKKYWLKYLNIQPGWGSGPPSNSSVTLGNPFSSLAPIFLFHVNWLNLGV